MWEGDLWPLYMSGLPVNVPRKVPLRQEIPSFVELYGETKWKVDKISEVAWTHVFSSEILVTRETNMLKKNSLTSLEMKESK